MAQGMFSKRERSKKEYLFKVKNSLCCRCQVKLPLDYTFKNCIDCRTLLNERQKVYDKKRRGKSNGKKM